MLESVTDALQRGEIAEALAAAQDAVSADPGNIEALHSLAIAQRADGDLDAARATLDQAIALAPDNAALFVSRAHLALAANDVEAAVAGFERGAQIDPNQLAAHVMLTQMALARGDLDAAESQQTLARRIAAEHPHVLLNEAGLAQARGDVDAAITHLSRALERTPEDPAVLAALGVAYLRKGLFAFAAEALQRAIEREPGSRYLRWAHVEALRRDGRDEEVLEAVRYLVQSDARDIGAQALLGDVLFALDRKSEALDAYRGLLQTAPDQLAVVDAVLRGLAARDAREDAVILLEERIAADPGQELMWQARMDVDAGQPESAMVVLSRWLQAQPRSSLANEREALRLESVGDFAGAERHADRALEVDPARSEAQLVKMRAELHADPEQALQRLDRLQAGARRPEAHRLVLGWRGLALERLGRIDEALEAWGGLQAHPLPSAPPPPPVRPAGAAADAVEGLSPVLLWGAPGAYPERVMVMLRTQDAYAMLDDRFGRGPRPDGFGPLLVDGENTPQPGIDAWKGMLDRAGLDPARVVDWLPHFDPAIDAALPGNRLIAVLGDPRDMLLNWWVYGSRHGVAFPGVNAAAQWLLDVLEPVAARLEANDGRTLRIGQEELEARPDRVAEALAGFLGLEKAPDASVIAYANMGQGGHPQFAAGHWQHYSTPLEAVFARLAPLARRLGY